LNKNAKKLLTNKENRFIIALETVPQNQKGRIIMFTNAGAKGYYYYYYIGR